LGKRQGVGWSGLRHGWFIMTQAHGRCNRSSVGIFSLRN
jgi:hypothetical protein